MAKRKKKKKQISLKMQNQSNFINIEGQRIKEKEENWSFACYKTLKFTKSRIIVCA